MARGNTQPEFLFDGIAQLDAGMNAGLAPQLLPSNQVSMATNMTFRGGFGAPRPSLREINLDFGGDVMLQANVTRHPFQGACYYQPDTGQEALVAAIGGKLFQFLPQDTTCPVKDVSIPNDPNPSNVQQAWLWAAERWVIWQDGVSLPVFFDGNTSRRSNGVNKILGTTSVFFVSPAVGATVIANLEEPYTGPTNIPVTVNGSDYILLSAASGSVSAAMAPVVGGSQHVFNPGDQIIAYANQIGMLLGVIPVGTTGEITVNCSPLVDVNGTPIPVGTVIHIGNDSFTLETLSPMPPIERGLFFNSVKLKVFGAAATTQVHNPFPTFVNCLITITTSLPNPLVGTLTAILDTGDLGVAVDATLTPTYTGPVQFVWIKDSRFQMVAVTPEPSNQVVLQNVDDTPGQNRFGSILGIDELPAGRMGTYGLGRVWMALTDGRSFMAGDIVGGTSGTSVYNFRDAVLRSTENTYLVGGGNFAVPGTLGDIRALRFSATLDASLGQGPLQVFTTLAAFSCAAPVDRTTWGMITNPILTQSLLGAGALSQVGTVLANGDIIFRAIDGARSLILGRRDFDTWGNVPQSREVQPILDQDNPTLIQYESAVVFDNRLLLTCLPTNGPLGVFCQGIVALNFDPISTLRGKQPSIYDGLWTGLQILQLVQGVFAGVDRCYAFCYDSVQGRMRLFEIQKTDAADSDNGTTPVTYSFESAALFNNIKGKGEFDQVELVDGEIYVSDVRGVVTFQTWYRPNYSDCWTPWIDFSICGNNTDTTKPLQYRTRLGLGSPPIKDCDPNTGQAMRIGNTFQFRIQVTGTCKFRGALFKAVKNIETRFSIPKCKPLCDVVSDANTKCEPCIDISNCQQFPLVLYNLNANKSYSNDAIVIQVTCPDGSKQSVPVPQGTINYTLPFPPNFAGPYPPLVMNCLGGGVIVEQLPNNATQSQIDDIVNGMILQCATTYAQSIAGCGTSKSFPSEQVSVAHECSEGTTLQFSGTLPSWIRIDTGTSTVIGNAGAVVSTISVEDATAKAQTQLQTWVDQQLGLGILSCQSPSNICTDGISGLSSNKYGIQGYVDGLIPNGGGGGGTWDGQFYFYMDGNDPNAGFNGWARGGTSDFITIDGGFVCNVSILFTGCVAGIPKWQMWIGDATNETPGNQLWYGEKSGGQTPEGIYNFVDGNAGSPSTLTIVLIDNTATPEEDSLFCSS